MNELTLSKNISVLRKAAGLTQEALAGKLGITFQAISKWENGLSCPDVQLLPDIADIFGVSIDELFGRRPAETQSAPEQPSMETEAADERQNPGEDTAHDLPWPDDNTLYVALYYGHKLLNEDALPLKHHSSIPFEYEGPALNISSALSVSVNGGVSGNVCAGGDINCESVGGNATAQGNIKCDFVGGSVYASDGDVDCDDVGGNVSCGGDVDCGDVGGDLVALSDVDCNAVNGDIRCGGDVDCTMVYGNVYAGGDVDCSYVEGDVEASGHAGFESEKKEFPTCSITISRRKQNDTEIEDYARQELKNAINSGSDMRSQLEEARLAMRKISRSDHNGCSAPDDPAGEKCTDSKPDIRIWDEDSKKDIKLTIDDLVDNVDNALDGILGKFGIKSKDKKD